jgi:DNA-binding NarL/FixJ family response regulator
MITVIIADDQRVVREGLTMVLGLMQDVEIVGTASDGQEAIQLVEQLNPDVVLMDLRMPHCDGVEATRRISETGTDTKVVVLTTYADDHSVIQALRAGACGFLTKDATNQQIAAALQAAKRGESAIDPAVQHHLVKAIARTAPRQWSPPDQARLPDGLTPREATVLTLIAEGLSNAEIAERRHRNHRQEPHQPSLQQDRRPRPRPSRRLRLPTRPCTGRPSGLTQRDRPTSCVPPSETFGFAPTSRGCAARAVMARSHALLI